MYLDRNHVRVQITNTYLPLLGVIQEKYGGSIYRRKYHHRARTLFDWVLRGDAAVQFLTKIRKLLMEKGVQVDLALASRFYGKNTAMFKMLNAQLKAKKRVDHGV